MQRITSGRLNNQTSAKENQVVEQHNDPITNSHNKNEKSSSQKIVSNG
jgi:hypothetical protein